ncbi:hypothetical protein CGCA056_v001801 [Colletotrichum aenigma]|uniref:uncharacterized protein n=1 Tax=Colletotrichum aenigma TaxID=1215731 RepID=UPI00187277CE|nr:uncharacterized protein CGCA056_v001801 [Colletotrichum aenigma]KAF5527856.1 hypothetical protein CGCA056_v001801 [Colletotrichum aenigma]
MVISWKHHRSLIIHQTADPESGGPYSSTEFRSSAPKAEPTPLLGHAPCRAAFGDSTIVEHSKSPSIYEHPGRSGVRDFAPTSKAPSPHREK